MKILTVLFILLASNAATYAQNLFEKTTLRVSKYEIVKGERESHVVSDVTELNVERGEDVFDKEYTKFSFVDAAGEQTFIAWFNSEMIHEENIVQRFGMLNGADSKPIVAYFFSEQLSIYLAIPDSDNGVIHKFELQTDEPYFSREYLAVKMKQEAAWDEFKTAFTKVINANDIAELRDGTESGVTIRPIGVNEKSILNYYDRTEFEMMGVTYVTQPKHIRLSVFSMAVWMGKKQSAEQIENDIKRIEASLDDVVGGMLEKVFYPMHKVKTIGESIADKKGTEKRESIKDNIFYVHTSEVASDLSEIKKSYIEVDVEMREFGTSLSITYYQY